MMAGLKALGGVLTTVLSFAYLILVLNPIQAGSMLIYPISPVLCRRINRWCARSIWGIWVIMIEVQRNIEVRISGDPLPRRENAFVISNHQGIVDIVVLLCLAWRVGRLSDMKWFVKEALKWVPGPGWGMYMLDCIFLKRNWAADKANIHALFSKFKRLRIPMFLISFLEGTRITPAKLARGQEFAREQGLYVPQHTLVPRTKGFVVTTQGLRDHLDAVYDLTMAYPNGVPSPLACMTGRVQHVDLHVRRYAMDSLPTEDEALTSWIFERYREKDLLLAEHAEKGEFPGPRVFGPIDPWDYFRGEAVPRAAYGELPTG